MTNYLNTNFDLNSDELINVLDELPIWSAPFGLKLLDKIKYRKNITALDIGFGAGFPLTEIAMRLGETCKVYGIDPWTAAIKRATEKIEFYGIKNVEILEGVAEEIPLPSNSVDLIVSNNGINNVSDLKKVLSECLRVLKQGGQFLMTMNLNTSMIEFYDTLKSILTESGMDAEIVRMKEQIYKKRKPLDEFLQLVEKVGFKVKDVEHDQFDYKFADGTTMLNHYSMRLAFIGGWKSIVPEDKQETIFREAEKRMNAKAESDGYFKLSIPFVVIDCAKSQ